MEKDLGKIKKNDNTDIVIRVDDFGGRPGLTIREFVTNERYTGFTKSGVKIPAADFKKFKEMVNSVSEEHFQADKVEGAQGKNLPKEQKTLAEKESGEEIEDY